MTGMLSIATNRDKTHRLRLTCKSLEQNLKRVSAMMQVFAMGALFRMKSAKAGIAKYCI